MGKNPIKGTKKIFVLFFFLFFVLQGSLFVANAEVSLPNPSLPNTSLPNPSLPNPSLPNPSLPNPSLPSPILPNTTISDTNLGNGNLSNGTDHLGSNDVNLNSGNGQATDGGNSGFGAWINNILGTTGDTLTEWIPTVGQFFSDSWEWVKENWEVTVTTVIGVALVVAGCFFPPLLVPGISLLVGEGLSGLAGYFLSGLTGKELTQEMAIGGILGVISGGLGGIVAKGISLGLTRFVAGNALVGAITSVVDDTLHNKKLDIGKMVAGALLAGGLGALAAGFMGNNTGLLGSITNSEKVSVSQSVSESEAIGGALSSTTKLLKETTCSTDDLYQYLKNIDSDAAELYLKNGTWPGGLQIPKSSDVLKTNGSIDWDQVPNNGYVLDGEGNAIKGIYSLKKGEVIDRYGPLNGTFTSPVNNNKPYSYDQRSLPYVEDTQQYHQFEIKDDFGKLKDYIINCTDTDLVNDINAYMKYKKISSYDDLLTYKGEIAAGFGSTGGGIQYQLPLPVNILEDLGIIKMIK